MQMPQGRKTGSKNGQMENKGLLSKCNKKKKNQQKAYESILQFKIKIHIVGSEKVSLTQLCLQHTET